MKRLARLSAAILAAIVLLCTLCSCGLLSGVDIDELIKAVDSIIDGLTEAEAGDATEGDATGEASADDTGAAAAPDRDGVYTSRDDVALYIRTYGELPSNFVTKGEAKQKGWSGNGGDALDNYAALKNKCIGGDVFGNYEKKLPQKSGRTYRECDIDTLNAKERGVKRLVFSSDGLIYYTEDHYETFILLYGEP
jgi:hypothetical protein